MKRRLLAVLKLGAAYAGTALLAAFVVVRVTARGSAVTVPPVAGLSFRDAQKALAARGLETSVGGEAWSEQVPAGAVLAQDPAPNARLKRGRRVRVTVSRGSEMLTMPLLTGSRQEEAEFLLRSLGLEAAAVAASPAAVPRRVVLAQDPSAGARVTRGQPVRLLASDGPAAPALAVPRVSGLAVREALARLRAAGLKIVSVAKVSTTAAAEGTVLAQDPPAGFRALRGDEVRLTAVRDSGAGGSARFAAITYVVPAGPARRVRVVIVDENGSREIANEIEEGGAVLRLSTRVQGDAAAQIFIAGALVEERAL